MAAKAQAGRLADLLAARVAAAQSVQPPAAVVSVATKALPMVGRAQAVKLAVLPAARALAE